MRRLFLFLLLAATLSLGIGILGRAILGPRTVTIAPLSDASRETSASMYKKVDALGASILFLGDIMLGRHVETLMRIHGENYPFRKIDEFLKDFDLVVGNLEGTVIKDHVQTPNMSFQFSFPLQVPHILKRNNISLVSLSNNHAYDYKEKGYLETKELLTEAGVEFFGHSGEVGEEYLITWDLNGKRAIFLGFNFTWGYAKKIEALEVVKRAKENADFIFLNIHWGDEYMLKSNEDQKNLAHAFIDSGADLIIGHHPHVVQEVELYNGKIIFYSLGNFIFDQYFSKETQEGLLVKFLLDEEERYELLPVQSYLSQPALIEGERKEEWLNVLSEKSSDSIKDQIRKGTIIITK